ncbi:MAG: hypothetical protein HGB36_14090 [Chlorobiaceae bacterium]|nr:hypothetical protein [Chlorobiaceae bacterium]
MRLNKIKLPAAIRKSDNSPLLLLQPFGQPDFYDGLSRNAYSRSLFIERFDHPYRKIHMHQSDKQLYSFGLVKIEASPIQCRGIETSDMRK